MHHSTFAIISLLLASCAIDPEVADDDEISTEEADLASDPVELAARSRDDRWPGEKYHMNLWDDNGFDDRRVSRETHDSTFKNDNFNDKASSLVNKTSSYWAIYEDTGYEGYFACVRPHSHVTNLKDHDALIGTWGDRISSMERINVNRCGSFIGDKN